MTLTPALLVVYDFAVPSPVLGVAVLVPASLVSDLAAASPAGFASAPPASDGLPSGFLPLSRKSVTYQPLPFNRKPAADTCFFNAGAPHSGQSVSGASLIFCNASSAWPQASQRYSLIGMFHTENPIQLHTASPQPR